MSTKPKRKTYADLQRKIRELESQMAHAYHFAAATLHKAGTEHMMGSGVLITLHANGGREIICPVMIKDGLSADTIAALHRDLLRSYDIAVAFKPKAAPTA